MSGAIVKSPSAKAIQKPLFVAHYEALLRGEDPANGNPNFWDDLFLLKVNVEFLESSIALKTESELLKLNKTINSIFAQAKDALNEESPIRVGHALETMTVLFRSIFRKKYANFAFDVVTLVSGVDNAPAFFRKLILNVQGLLLDDQDALKERAIGLLLTIATATDNVNQNTLLDYFMQNDICDVLLEVVMGGHPSISLNTLVLLTLLVQFQKFETSNPYVKRIQTIRSDVTLQRISTVLQKAIQGLVASYRTHVEGHMKSTAQSAGWSGYLASWFSSAGGKEPIVASGGPPLTGAVLLGLYEFMVENRYFGTSYFYKLETKTTNIPPEMALQVSKSLDNLFLETPPKRIGFGTPGLLTEMLKLTSLVFKDSKDFKNQLYSKLILIILTANCENADIGALLFDEKLASKWEFPPEDNTQWVTGRAPAQNKLLALQIYDLVLIFLKRNIKKDFAPDLCIKSLELFHRLLCYQKKQRLKVAYKWVNHWRALLALMKHICDRELFLQKNDMVQVADKLLNVFNMFITFGDQFLPTLEDYDDLYYELVRSEKDIRAFLVVMKEFDTARTWAKDSENIASILDHFSHRIEALNAANPASSLDTKGVIKVIQDNYNSLKLKLTHGLDRFESYSEHPKETLFFRQLVRALVADFKLTALTKAPTLALTVSAPKAGHSAATSATTSPVASPPNGT